MGLNAAHPETRRRFAAAAALGRLRLHPDVEFFLENRPQLRAGDPASAEAAVFAAVLLVPLETIAETFRDADVEDDRALDFAAAACGVSASVVRFRVGLLSMGLEK